MLNLILKDILVQKKQMLLSFVYIPFMFFAFQGVGSAVFSAGVVGFTYMMVMTACAYEDKNKADIMINSLPLRRNTVVLAKYMSVLVYFTFGTIAYVLFTSLLSLFGYPLQLYPLTIDGFVGGIAGVTLISGIYFPVFFKMGYLKSKIINFLLFFGFFIGISTLSNILMNENMRFGKDIQNFLVSFGDEIIALIAMVGLFIFMSISYSLSVRFYKAREF